MDINLTNQRMDAFKTHGAWIASLRPSEISNQLVKSGLIHAGQNPVNSVARAFIIAGYRSVSSKTMYKVIYHLQKKYNFITL